MCKRDSSGRAIMKTPEHELGRIWTDMETMERSGELDRMFKGDIPVARSSTRETFKETIKPSMKLTKRTFLNILAYDISTPGYADEMLARMELLGCANARNYYAAVKIEWKYYHEKEMKSAAEWYRKQNFERKEVNDLRRQEKQQKAEQLRADLQQKSDRELLTLLQRLRLSGA